MKKPLVFAYYCSGHGYGHATRVSAFARHLLNLDSQMTIHIISSAPKHVFSDSISLGVLYRFAEIDPVVVQPVAYRVDRHRSVEALRSFLARKESLLAQEKHWLFDIQVDCVLSDAAFLGCEAANAAGLPSILISNFTFDSVYSYLSTTFTDQVDVNAPLGEEIAIDNLAPDYPISDEELKPLVQQIYYGYRCADLLVRLPGCIPIPSFSISPSLPAPPWTDQDNNTILDDIVAHLVQEPTAYALHSSIPFADSHTKKPFARSIIQAPLLVRGITNSPDTVYSPVGRSQFLSSIGVPEHLHNPDETKILIVSFGGQVFRRPTSSRGSSTGHSSPGSRTPRNHSPAEIHDSPLSEIPPCGDALRKMETPSRPPVIKPVPSPTCDNICAMLTKTESCFKNNVARSYFDAFASDITLDHAIDNLDARLLPDSSWIAIVCGVSKWGQDEADEKPPDRFFVAPKYVYMPDLTAVADVLLGKLGYGTVSECVDSCTPFVYVARPIFVEEHGLKLLLAREGVGIEISREAYETGEWASAVEDAWSLGKNAKAEMRRRGRLGIDMDKRDEEGKLLAGRVTDWVKTWHDSISQRSVSEI
ncbi:hypothetical protein DEU56DRAFT_747920 [Suillus clintonianus]|uniref:uncharacterized protein n=1 Tax=Suillus clintonianus TaxID=1904413 RepID=UPI001B87B9F4|nr:uncharacterized protein DEU56DRAFT_747920 [Suillus clintonianus]KAG2117753.1 hypothetical protein DEU56DRAFT_747920 [Suillus clintonianus]